MKLDFDDILIVPADITDINSRSEVNPFYTNGNLPIFAAPMDTVVDQLNIKFFLDSKINVVLPRQGTIAPHHYSTNPDVFYAYGLADFNAIFLGQHHIKDGTFYALLDVANGHMPAVKEAIMSAKLRYGHRIVIMAGNVANPATYAILSQAGADYVRVGIGNGCGCLTTQQTGVGYPMASLISACYAESMMLIKPAKIVADGGFKKYADIIKALALGADYVMLGSILNKALESAGDTIDYGEQKHVNQYLDNTLERFKNFYVFYKKFRGMSTKEVQKSLGNEILKTSEGVVREDKVEYTLQGWAENFEHYLRSAMSYTDSQSLNDFIGEVNTIVISENAFNRYNK